MQPRALLALFLFVVALPVRADEKPAAQWVVVTAPVVGVVVAVPLLLLV